MSIRVVTGRTMRIRFDGKKCIHSRNCVLGQPDVFKANVKRDWIDPDGASPEELLALAVRCPSGAIVVERIDGTAVERPSGHNVVAVLENGPYAVRGALSVDGDETLRATLCRCGASKNKPYCDNSHVAAGFTATGEHSPRPSSRCGPNLDRLRSQRSGTGRSMSRARMR